MRVSVVKPPIRPVQSFFMHRIEGRTKNRLIHPKRDWIEISYVCSGNGYLTYNNKQYKVFKGDLFIINANVPHSLYRDETRENLVTYKLDFNLDFIGNYLSDMNGKSEQSFQISFIDTLDSTRVVEHIRLNSVEQAEIEKLFTGMYQEYNMKQQGYMSVVRAHLIEMIVKLTRVISEEKKCEKKYANTEWAISSAIKYVQENFLRGISLNELSVRFSLSKPHFCKMFKEYTGMTMFEYVQTLRINEACKMLESTSRKVVDIGLDAGFSDYKSFKNTFKKVKGVLPSQYRKLTESQCKAEAFHLS